MKPPEHVPYQPFNPFPTRRDYVLYWLWKAAEARTASTPAAIRAATEDIALARAAYHMAR